MPGEVRGVKEIARARQVQVREKASKTLDDLGRSHVQTRGHLSVWRAYTR